MVMETTVFNSFKDMSDWSAINCRTCEKNNCFLPCKAHQELWRTKPVDADPRIVVSESTFMFIGAESNTGKESWTCPEHWYIGWG
jgi:hypothetical protein